MGELQKRLGEFQRQTGTAYQEIMNILEDKYCWKCPMRSTSKNSRCREIHAGKVLHESMDKGITCKINEHNVHPVEIEALIMRMLKKKIKNQGGRQGEKIIIISIETEQNPALSPENKLMVKINPRKIRKGETILIPDKPGEHPLLGAYALVAGFPFQVAVVEKVFHEGNFWYVKMEDEQILPLESVFGVLLKVLEEEDSL
ncbi:hypothetical protein [Methanobacterium sp.]|uniref:hypothetical protein n=1 Tax=Methanobacterium sp. TaxID=2164 RepID=UPI002AB90C5B|nr:hypothetical protein [Methanobacterium sp.]MDY9924060.1 hypothetical protein [Methanobacterium sp.]